MPREFQIFSLGPSMAPPQHSQQLSLCATNGQILQEVRSSDQHPPNVPPVGLQPDSSRALDYGVGRCDVQFNYGFEREKRLTEKDFFENLWNPTSVYVGQPQVVSTSLGLSLENTSKDSVVGFDCKLKRQDAEIDMIFKLKVDWLRRALLENLQSARFQTFSTFVEERIIQKLRQKEVEVEAINKRTIKLEEEFELLSTKVSGLEQRARYSGRMITPLVFTLRQIYAQNRASQEGFGDSEVVDDVGLLGKSENELKETMTCKVCRANKVSILLLPCKHLCLCKDCKNKITICPICRSPKLGITEVYM